MKHNFNSTEWAAKKNAKVDLSKPHGALNSVKDLRDRLAKIERLLDIKPSEA